MKSVGWMKWLLIAVGLVVAGTAPAWADRGHGGVRFGVYMGPPVWGPMYYPQPYYYPPYAPIVIERAPPPVYIEQAAPVAPPPAQTSYWYYCAASRAYYPYVNECPGGWMKVLPQPPGQP